MPYNTTAIPPRKEVTVSRVKKIIAQDQDINICSNNAAFVITLATEMFIQYLAGEGVNMAKLERKPRRNIQYKDLANAVSHQDNLQFLEDIIPKTVPYKQIKAHAAATRASLSGGAKGAASTTAAAAAAAAAAATTATQSEDSRPTPPRQTNGKKQKGRVSAGATSNGNGGGNSGGNGNGNRSIASLMGVGGGTRTTTSEDDVSMDPNEQLQDEMRRANGDSDDDDNDVQMAD